LDTKNYIIFRNVVEIFTPKKNSRILFFSEGKLKNLMEYLGIYHLLLKSDDQKCNLHIPFQQGVCHIAALPFTLKSILMQNKNYENSNISPCKNINLQKNALKETKILQDIIITLL
jgi:hypothetical protein